MIEEPKTVVQVKVKQGFHVAIRGPKFANTMRRQDRYKHGITHELKDWLDLNIGQTVGNSLWELEGLGDWIHTGARYGKYKFNSEDQTNESELMLDFYFRDRRKAIMFKIVWARYHECPP